MMHEGRGRLEFRVASEGLKPCSFVIRKFELIYPGHCYPSPPRRAGLRWKLQCYKRALSYILQLVSTTVELKNLNFFRTLHERSLDGNQRLRALPDGLPWKLRSGYSWLLSILASTFSGSLHQ